MTWRGRGSVARRAALGVMAVVLSVGCTDGVQQVEPIDCHPLTDEGCPAGTHCRLLAAGARACLAPGAPTPMGCAPGNCAVGEACAVIEGRAACRAVCDLNLEGACAEGTCGYPLVESDGQAWGVCLRSCTLGSCAAGATCAPIAAARHPICVAAGDAAAGEPCSVARCAAGMGCLLRDDEPRCTPLCRPGMSVDCPMGQCVGIVRDSEGLQYCDGE